MEKLDVMLLLLAAILIVEVLSMTTGAPDWQGMRWKVEATKRPNLIYPSGKIILYDDFESPPLKWADLGSAGYDMGLRTNKAFNGTNSLMLETGLAAPYNVQATRYMGKPPSKKAGIQLAYHVPVTGASHITFGIEHYDGTTRTQSVVRYDFTNAKWQYYNSAAAWTDIPGATQDISETPVAWHFVKLSADIANAKFTSLRSNAEFWDLSAYALRTTASGTAELLDAYVLFTAPDATQLKVYIDNATITEE